MTVKEISHYLDASIPLALQESYDNAGLLAGDPEEEVSGILITLDVTEDVIREAMSKGFNMIIAHHPIIFNGLKRLTGKNLVERCVMLAIKNDIALYAAHTNLDHLKGGVSYALAEKLGLQDIRTLRPMATGLRKLVTFCPMIHAEEVREALFNAGAGHIGNYDACSYNTEGYGTFRALQGANPFVGKMNSIHNEAEVRIETIFPEWKLPELLEALHKTHPYEEVAYDIYPIENKNPDAGPGVVGSIPEETNTLSFLNYVKETTSIPVLKHTTIHKESVRKLALCGGAGSFLIQDAIRSGADIYITGDLKYHDYFLAEGKIILVDSGHFETEQFAPDILRDILLKKFPNFAVLISEVNTNPVNYL